MSSADVHKGFQTFYLGYLDWFEIEISVNELNPMKFVIYLTAHNNVGRMKGLPRSR